jgi:hypothetical protein
VQDGVPAGGEHPAELDLEGVAGEVVEEDAHGSRLLPGTPVVNIAHTIVLRLVNSAQAGIFFLT